ncbi:MAG: hypothetical protein FWF96_03855, partial [Kiritimatiellaeota bacterium]|nr:hypothetical protein [Kiritimatiellota bacterium]
AMEEVKKTKGIFTRQKGFSVLFFAFLGLGMMAKGPVAVVLAGLPIFIYVGLAKRWKELTRHAWVAGPLVFFAIALPWYALMAKRDPDFLEYFFLNENFLRFLKPEYGDKYGSGHDTFKGMALVWFAVASLPWLPLAIGTGVWRRGRQWMSRKDFSSRPELALPLLGCLCMTAFWCLTSRALLPYLLPAAPLVAVWAAAKLDEWGVLEARGWGRTLGALAPFACFVVWVGICIATWLGQNVNGKMPRRIYRELSRIQAETPAYADAKFEFMHNDPYSAEFYLGDATRRDLPADVQGNPGLIREKQERAREAMAREGDDAAKARIHAKLATDALARSRGDFFFVTRKQMAFFDEPPQREVAYSNRAWTVYAPVARGAE